MTTKKGVYLTAILLFAVGALLLYTAYSQPEPQAGALTTILGYALIPAGIGLAVYNRLRKKPYRSDEDSEG